MIVSPPTSTISAQDPHPRRELALLGTRMRYVDSGRGDPIVFLHGNPTSSYLWRNVIPHVDDLGRCLAPDLVGMGGSGESADGGYRFADHARHLDAWFDALALERVVLVLHDWGSALGFDWARRHPERVQAIAYMEALVQPRRWEDFPDGRDRLFRALCGEDGERLVHENNFFVEQVLPRSILRTLDEAEMDAYRAPFREPAARAPTLVWARELPIDGSPADVAERVEAYAQWLAWSPLPKLFVNAEPGALLTGRARHFCRSWANQREITVPGIHYVQEDAPDEIGRALRDFVVEVRAARGGKIRDSKARSIEASGIDTRETALPHTGVPS
ncbi:haloalkane dehalogenase [Lysobacter sp. 5GHs7-4]|uniref:haloalkane dehalogenase n=1 Tax=Lysobacter sp. 5GHs7-4 TaxID=2904253 RepID=UPI001E362C57|nr:haloalkane dehalogenase [Lysobacter sp. 5GHs7-4]UHQ23899.1 haloalkane dehalogenase [Lysobacter sp. 5GHs7-4]